MKIYKAAIYLRLSKEDDNKNNSIDMQREITTKYAIEHNYYIFKEYVDNGYSGMLDHRPSLDEMMADIKEKRVNMLIVKDMSRLTRNKSLASYYTDIFFPEHDVRFISVTEFVDSGKRYEIDEAVALRSLVNQSYLEDISRKIKAVKREFKLQGKFIEAFAAYGYKKDPKDRQKIVVDENIRAIIKFIFQEYLAGSGPTKIAMELNKQNIITPSKYLKMKQSCEYWNGRMVSRILNNPIYTGREVINKSETNLKLKKVIMTSKSKYEFALNTHEAIISIEDFEKVQSKMSSRLKSNQKKNKYISLLKGLVHCKNCGCIMEYKNPNPVIMLPDGKIMGKENNLGYYICEERNRNPKKCNIKNKICEKNLNKIVITEVQKRLRKIWDESFEKRLITELKNSNEDFIKLKKANKQLETKKLELKELYEKELNNNSRKEFLIRYEKYKKEVKELANIIKVVEDKPGKEKVSKELDEMIKRFKIGMECNPDLIKILVDDVNIDENNVIVVFKG